MMRKDRFLFGLKKIRRKAHEDRGQALVEFALALPVLLIVFGAVVDIGRMINYKIVLQSAASDSVKNITQASDVTSDKIRENLESEYGNQLDVSQLQIDSSKGNSQQACYTYHANTASSGGGKFVNKSSYYYYFDATVTLTYKVPMITPVMALIVGKNVMLSSTFTGQVYEKGYNG